MTFNLKLKLKLFIFSLPKAWSVYFSAKDDVGGQGTTVPTYGILNDSR